MFRVSKNISSSSIRCIKTNLKSNIVCSSNIVHSSRNYSSPSFTLPAFDYTPEPYNGPSYEEVEEARKKYCTPALLTYYKKPIMLVEGKQQYYWDQDGRRYLDMFAGIVTVSVGHCHPKIVEAGVDQMKKLMHSTTIYYNPEVSLFAKELASKLPEGLDVIYFVNSGSEANDLAMLMSRLYTHNHDIVALRNGYHGMSQGTMGLTALSTWRYPGAGVGEGIKHVLNPDRYRGPYGYDDPDAGKKYALDVKNLIEHVTPGQVGGFIAEYIQGVGGSVHLPDGYLKEAYKHVRNAGGVCIADEVQTGFGRMGTHYWAFESQDVKPDIVTMAKGIGNGAPLAAVATTREIAETLTQRITFNTYGGNPVSSAIGRAVLRVIDEENIQQNSHIVGSHLKEGLNNLAKKHDIIGDVRGMGLMLGMELVKDKNTKEPATAETAEVFERAKDYGVLIGKGGLYGNVFRIKPPMCVNKEDADVTLEVLDQCLSEL